MYLLKIDLHILCMTKSCANVSQKLSIAQPTCFKWRHWEIILWSDSSSRLTGQTVATEDVHGRCTSIGEERWLQDTSILMPWTKQPSVVWILQVFSWKAHFSPVSSITNPGCGLQDSSEIQTKSVHKDKWYLLQSGILGTNIKHKCKKIHHLLWPFIWLWISFCSLNLKYLNLYSPLVQFSLWHIFACSSKELQEFFSGSQLSIFSFSCWPQVLWV